MKVVGITGGIGSGKSAVTDYLAKKGFPVIDADVIARRLTEPGQEGFRAVVGLFGEGVVSPDGSVDRKRVAEKVFSDETKRLALNAALHSMVIKVAAEQAEEYRLAGASLVFLSAPLLFEAGMDDRTDEVWLVDADYETRLQRVVRRDGLREEDVRKRMEAQMSSDEKRKRVKIVIDNTGTFDDLRRSVDMLLEGEAERWEA
ncbi:MAG: dephospho-CoA kinase [Clostridiales Family XIII bacterium]|jgi:dephospho-CoA kinase|nr:dephospho-CoA kinase [Clostridiales Family XIII bacterium]